LVVVYGMRCFERIIEHWHNCAPKNNKKMGGALPTSDSHWQLGAILNAIIQK
jgi:hypothetical protein